jgi:GNAT superfamily N-acetyltransferase
MNLVTLDRSSLGDVRDVLCEAFADYPVMRYVLGSEGDYRQRLGVLVGLFVAGRMLGDDVALGILDGSKLAGTATIALPDTEPPPEVEAVREQAWRALGPDALARYQRFSTVSRSFAVERPHLFLDMLGVRSRYKGRGLGRLLLDAVHDHSRAHVTSEGVRLTTENPANVELYRHFGYRLIGHAPVADGLETWVLFRSD